MNKVKGKIKYSAIIYVVVTIGVSSGSAVAVNSADSADRPVNKYISKIKNDHKTDAELKGFEIYKKQYLIDEGWKDMDVEMSMELIDANGRKSFRKVIKRTYEDGKNPDKTVGIFLEPADIKGTVMLTFENSYGPDEQWLYLPSLKRTKKINAENKSGSFLGTEFSWEDISTTELSKYRYNYISENDKWWKIERTPVYEFSGYSREITWVDKGNHQTKKIEYYDKKGDLLKVLELGDWEKYKNRYWRPKLFTMINMQNNRKTVLTLKTYAVDAGLNPRLFTSFGLKRISYSASK